MLPLSTTTIILSFTLNPFSFVINLNLIAFRSQTRVLCVNNTLCFLLSLSGDAVYVWKKILSLCETIGCVEKFLYARKVIQKYDLVLKKHSFVFMRRHFLWEDICFVFSAHCLPFWHPCLTVSLYCPMKHLEDFGENTLWNRMPWCSNTFFRYISYQLSCRFSLLSALSSVYCFLCHFKSVSLFRHTCFHRNVLFISECEEMSLNIH